MPLRTFFEALGEFFNGTFNAVMPVGPVINWIFGLTMAGFGAYWLYQMTLHSRRGEK
jgi:hypothetical protein